MKLTKQAFLNWTRYPHLANAVLNQMAANWSEVIKYPEDYRDAGAGVGGFIYYTETEPFARKHLELIMQVLNEFEEETGADLPKDKDNFLNWCAWFALETTIQEIMDFKEDAENGI